VARLVVVSYRLGGTDGVSIEAAKWIAAFQELGHHVTTFAGEGDADVVLPELAADSTVAPSLDDVNSALARADLVVVENLVSLPLNVGARDVLYQALAARRALFRHHDLPWQRDHLQNGDAPRDQAFWRQVVINDLSRHELELRGISATTIRNTFDCKPPAGRREGTRRELGIGRERLALLATRAIPRKNIEGALRLARSLDATLWLLGPTEDGYAPALESLLANSSVRVVRGLPDGVNIHDAYSAADLVVVPSTWEGFGNPVLESVTHRRPLAVYPYPVLEEIRSFGFTFFELDDADGIVDFLDRPDEALLDHNLEIAHQHFNVADLPGRLAPVLEEMGIN